MFAKKINKNVETLKITEKDICNNKNKARWELLIVLIIWVLSAFVCCLFVNQNLPIVEILKKTPKAMFLFF
jgi:hypothetical protein